MQSCWYQIDVISGIKDSLPDAKEVIKSLWPDIKRQSVVQSCPVSKFSVQKKTSPITKFDAVRLTLHLIYYRSTSVWNRDPNSKLQFCLRPEKCFPFSFVLNRKKKKQKRRLRMCVWAVRIRCGWRAVSMDRADSQAACPLSHRKSRERSCCLRHRYYDSALVRLHEEIQRQDRRVDVEPMWETFLFCLFASLCTITTFYFAWFYSCLSEIVLIPHQSMSLSFSEKIAISST